MATRVKRLSGFLPRPALTITKEEEIAHHMFLKHDAGTFVPNKTASEAKSFSHVYRRLCAMITMDVKNTFKSASWQLILKEMRRSGIEKRLISIIASYLSERWITLESGNITKQLEVSRGVSQGSVLGPTL